ncbi:hypothetical protein FNF27_07389 [Cafeteria roenbergensis]|uniref:Uncharacterized protein n=1 Tax=Cafeteria roenbergensis TaxID=33653 RepID=A0A5A8C7J2_CAFRO|nr:hypothetical protein FNF29_07820 [Cafeteria roenbergensis]KAA0148070.1 hypothetical protein FNF31_07486 [Cafeteria roenbergensis]KAA0164368.1 hypothetical protein FNF28_03908 [Cafeteria roenbergensis]KAA0167061.1 hypothetical protein FNF27_07389 [Cafeteria roenbergensis]|eukprot:KAA0146844.1 hypothetical protein FNF29_07820 [Cafeteria roenbergensis]
MRTIVIAVLALVALAGRALSSPSEGARAASKRDELRSARFAAANDPPEVVQEEQANWFNGDESDELSEGDKAFIQTLRAMADWDVDERALFSCDPDRTHVRVGNIEEVNDPATTSNRELSHYMQRYNLADAPPDCCERFVKHGGSRMPLLEWLATTYFSVAMHDSSGLRVEISDMLPSSVLGFCRGLNGEDGTINTVHSGVRRGMQPTSKLVGFMHETAALLDVCSGATDGPANDAWIDSATKVLRYVCTEE